MNNKEKYEGKTVRIYAPFGGRYLGMLKVDEVMDDNILCGTIPGSDIDTAYWLSDGIRVEIVEQSQA